MQVTSLLASHLLAGGHIQAHSHLFEDSRCKFCKKENVYWFLRIISLKGNLECESVWISCCCNVLENLVPAKLSPWAIIEQVPLSLLCWCVLAKCYGEICGDNKPTVSETLKLQGPYVVSDCGAGRVLRKLWPWRCSERLTNTKPLELSNWLPLVDRHHLSLASYTNTALLH